MSGLTVATFPKQKAVLPGEATPIDTVAENNGGGAIQFESSDGPSPFAYELLADKDRTVRYRVSELQRDARRTKDIPPEQFFPPQSIDPNHRVHRDEDLADLASEDFLPGKYLIRALYPADGAPQIVSPLSPITILVPKIESFSSEVCGNRNVLVTAYAHRREDGGVLIVQREAGTDPRENSAFRRLQLDPGPKVQVAVAVDAMNAGNGRWFGWLRAGKFEAAVGWGNRLLAQTPPMRVGREETVLLSPGFQVDVGTGLFGFIDVMEGVAKLRAVRTTGKGIAPAFEVELTSAAEGVRGFRWNYRPESGITVFWQDAANQVYRRRYDPQGRPLDAAPVRTTTMTPVAWSSQTLGDPDLQMIVRAPDGRLFFRKIDEQAGAAPVALPPLENQNNPSFAFCSIAEGKTKVVAAAGGKIWGSTLDAVNSTAWVPVGEAVEPSYLHVFSPRGKSCWVEWFEKNAGLRRALLR